MSLLGQILKRTFFWTYERGTWQYDVAVVLIVIFCLLTPRPWFHDQPEVGMAAGSGLVSLVAGDSTTRTYRVDARVLAPPARTPELSSDLHQALKKSVPELAGRGFEILQIEPTRDAQGTVISYEVKIKR